MVGVHELTVEQALWLTRMSRGRLLKDPIELGMPGNVRADLIAKGLAVAQGGLLEITPEGLAETVRRGEPAAQDTSINRAPVLLVISPLPAEAIGAAWSEGRERQKRMSAHLLRIAVDAAIIDHAASKLNELATTETVTALEEAAPAGAAETIRRTDSDHA